MGTAWGVRTAGVGRGVDTWFTTVISLFVDHKFRWWLSLKVHLLIWRAAILLCLVHSDGFHILMVPAAHVPPRVGKFVDCWKTTISSDASCYNCPCFQFAAPSTYGKPLGIISFFAYDFRQYSPTGIDKPVTNLENCQTSLLSKSKLLSIARVGIVPVIIQPPA